MRISHSDKKKPTIVISGGDPSGIGPEIILKALQEPSISKKSEIIIVGTFRVFKKTAKKLNIDLSPGRGFTFVDLQNIRDKDFRYKAHSPRCGEAALEYIMYAASIAEKSKHSALVTAPISKESINKAGYRFRGHTEFLAHITRSKNVTMMLIGGKLRVSLVTRHIPLMEVPNALTAENIIRTTENTYYALKEFFRISNPKIGIASLNPHAGEGGVLGKEEKTIIAPAVKRMKRKMNGIVGPLPADTIFYKAYKGGLDAVVCMYHDQGLIPLKMTAFEKGVNLTIGLPFVRTSPDHGTAFDIAGKGKADPSSMIEAMKLAASIC